MRELLERAQKLLKPLGYIRQKARFFKTECGFFKQIDFQSGAFGKYFFVNISIHPIGLPKLLAGRLVIPDRPLEHECIMRQRIERIVLNETTAMFRSGLASCGNQEVITSTLSAISIAIDSWLPKWCSYSTILNSSDKELKHMLTVAPLVFEKASAMLKLFCALRSQETTLAQSYLAQCISAPSGDYDFSLVDDYMRLIVSQDNTVDKDE